MKILSALYLARFHLFTVIMIDEHPFGTLKLRSTLQTLALNSPFLTPIQSPTFHQSASLHLPSSDSSTSAALSFSRSSEINVTIRDWTVSTSFDNEINDRFNFGLDDNAVSVISAVLTGYIILLFTDLVFRTIVRARPASLTSHVIYRAELMSRCVNPLTWLSNLSHISTRICHIRSDDKRRKLSPEKGIQQSSLHPLQIAREDDMVVPPGVVGPLEFPTWRRALILVVGILLTSVQILLIFLATTKNTSYPIDLRRIPSFEIRDPGNTALLIPTDVFCSSKSLLSKNGFSSLANILICSPTTPDEDLTITTDDRAMIAIAWLSHQVQISVFTNHLFAMYTQHVFVSVENGSQYTSEVHLSERDALTVLPAVLNRHGIPISGNLTERNVNDSPNPNWAVIFFVNLQNISLPTNFLPFLRGTAFSAGFGHRNYSITSAGWNFYLASIARSVLDLTGRSKAHMYGMPNGPFLHEYPGAVVISQRPWMSVAICIALCAGLFILWCFIAFGKKWRGHIDGVWVWKDKFGIETIDDLGSLPEQTVDLP